MSPAITLHFTTLKAAVLFRVTFAGAGLFFFGYQQGILNLSLPTIVKVFDIEERSRSFYEGVMSCLSPVGAIIGCIIASEF